jgi:hypothetical protein
MDKRNSCRYWNQNWKEPDLTKKTTMSYFGATTTISIVDKILFVAANAMIAPPKHTTITAHGKITFKRNQNIIHGYND